MNTQLSPLRIALIGCGNHSQYHHADAMSQYSIDNPDEVELCAVCDIDMQRARHFQENYGFKAVFTDIDQLLAENSPDAVVCVMPVSLNVKMAVKLLQAGVCSLIEKPLGENLADAKKLETVANQTATPHMVSMNRHFLPVMQSAKNWLAQRKICYIRACILRNRRFDADFISATAIHPIDAMTHILGPVQDFSAKIIDSDTLKNRWCEVSLKFPDCQGTLVIAPTCGKLEETYELFGEDFCIKLTMFGENSGFVECFENGQMAYSYKTPDNCPRYVINGAYNEFAAFVDAIKGRAAFSPTVFQVLNPSKVCFKIAEKFDL